MLDILNKIKYTVDVDKIVSIVDIFINSGEADKYFKDLEDRGFGKIGRSYRYELENALYFSLKDNKDILNELSLKILKIRSKYLPVKWNEAEKLDLIPNDSDLRKAINSEKFLNIWNRQGYDYSLSNKDINNLESLLPEGYYIRQDNDYAICYRYGNRYGEWIMLSDIWQYIEVVEE